VSTVVPAHTPPTRAKTHTCRSTKHIWVGKSKLAAPACVYRHAAEEREPGDTVFPHLGCTTQWTQFRTCVHGPLYTPPKHTQPQSPSFPKSSFSGLHTVKLCEPTLIPINRYSAPSPPTTQQDPQTLRWIYVHTEASLPRGEAQQAAGQSKAS
jgi:hypothetical protein